MMQPPLLLQIHNPIFMKNWKMKATRTLFVSIFCQLLLKWSSLSMLQIQSVGCMRVTLNVIDFATKALDAIYMIKLHIG